MDCGGFDCRAGDCGRHFFNSGGNGEIGRFSVLAACDLDCNRFDDAQRRVVLRRTGGAVSRSGRKLRLSARNLWQNDRVSLRLDGFARSRSGIDGDFRRRTRKLRRIFSRAFARRKTNSGDFDHRRRRIDKYLRREDEREFSQSFDRFENRNATFYHTLRVFGRLRKLE